MDTLKITIKGLFNSFRIGEFHTYQKTLPFPPKTTIIGMIGAALGIPPEEANELTPDLKIAILINKNTNQGEAKDLWRYLKYKAGAPKPISDILIREILFNNSFTIFFATEKTELLKKINQALLHPKWALSLGREEELILIIDIIYPFRVDLVNSDKKIKLRNTIVNFKTTECARLSDNALSDFMGGRLKAFSPPKSFKLPTSFSYSEKGRIPKDYQTFSVIDDFEIEIDNQKVKEEFYTDGTRTIQFF